MALSYNHDQTALSFTWNINHALNKDAVVNDVYVYTIDTTSGTLTKILPFLVTHVDNNNLQIVFTDPGGATGYAGKVRIVV